MVLVQRGVMFQLKDVINTMMDNLQRKSFVYLKKSELKAKVTKAVALGDPSKQIEANARGAIPDLKNTITSVGGGSHSGHFRSRKSRQTRRSSTCIGHGRSVVEFGSEHQLRSNAVVTTAVARGDLTQKIEISVEGFVGTVNSTVDQLSAFAFEVTRVALEVGTQERQENGFEADQVAFVNVDVQEEILDLKMPVNSMAAQLSTSANEVTQVSLEVRREGILGGQAFVPDVQGMWKVGDFQFPFSL
ncbi:hypothetical protein BYT27DRAFT_7206365 [Phlegmacium glaucopus]|nr:hypothetical protein BYT27DRAFT_7206365 [Phlegmacium glaucopus]